MPTTPRTVNPPTPAIATSLLCFWYVSLESSAISMTSFILFWIISLSSSLICPSFNTVSQLTITLSHKVKNSFCLSLFPFTDSLVISINSLQTATPRGALLLRYSGSLFSTSSFPFFEHRFWNTLGFGNQFFLFNNLFHYFSPLMLCINQFSKRNNYDYFFLNF